MQNLLNKILRQWPIIISGLVILAFILWPVFTHPGGDSYTFSFLTQEEKILPQKSAPVISKPENTLVFGGDIMLSRTVNAKMEKYGSYDWPFAKISTLFSEADLAIANLESPFVFAGNYQVLTGSFSFKANPLSVSSLVLAGFDVLSLANNHALNQGIKGIDDTKTVLSEAGISYTGLSTENLVIRESNGVKFGFLAYTYNDDSALIANMNDLKKLQADVVSAKEKADVVIVIMHAGIEYVREPNRQQRDFAYEAIDSGADLVVGHHPHWPQVVEDYQGKKIIYSLGNLVFDQMWSKETSQGLVVKIFFDGKELTNIEYIPIVIKDYGQAEIMTDGAEKEQMLKDIKVLSD